MLREIPSDAARECDGDDDDGDDGAIYLTQKREGAEGETERDSEGNTRASRAFERRAD